MNKEELINEMAAETGLTKAAAGRALNAFTEAVTRCAARGEDVALVGFGTFKAVKRKGRTGKDPRTGADITIKARKVLVFKTSSMLNKSLN